MKCRISVTIDEKTYFEIFEALRTKKYRSKSQLVQNAVKRMLRKK